MRRFVCFLFFTFGIFLAFGQNDKDYSINTKNISLRSGNIKTITTITNNCLEDLFLFYEPDTSLSNYDMIRGRFYKREEGASMTLLQWLLDGNVNWDYKPKLDQYFVKVIQPNKTFTIQTLDGKLSKTLINSLRIIPESEIREIGRSLPLIKNSDSPMVYKQDVLVIP